MTEAAAAGTIHGSRRSRVLLFSPVLLALLVVVPRLSSPNFGLLDDAHMLRLAPLASASLYPGSGRFVPGYTLFQAGARAIAGARPLGLFLVNSAVMAAVVAGLIALIWLRGGGDLEAWAAGVLLVLSGPAMENLYTLSKPEPAQALWLVLSLLVVASAPAVERPWRRAARFAVATAALLLAMTTKETAIVMIPISLGWLLIGWWRGGAGGPGVAVRAGYAGACVTAGAITFALRVGMGAGLPAQGTYGGLYRLAPDTVRLSLSDWLVWLLRDFAYLIPLALILAGLAAVGRLTQKGLLLEAAVWMAGWIAIFLPWSWIRLHYLFPFALGATAVGGVALGQALRGVAERGRPLARTAIAVALAASLVLWAMTLANLAGDAAIQIAVDEANRDMVRFVATVPPGSALSLNMPNPSEYVYEIGLHLADLEGRPDIAVGYFDALALARDREGGRHYVAVPVLRHEVTPTFRTWVTEAGSREWERAVLQALGGAREQVLRVRREVRLRIFNIHRPLCEWARLPSPYCLGSAPLIDTRVLSYGWDVYRALGETPLVAPTGGEGRGRDAARR